MLRNLLALRQIGQRTISTTSRTHFKNRVAEKQKLFQEEDGIPVYLKGGIVDVILYRATMILTVGGKAFGMFEGAAYAIYHLAVASFPKKQD
uniref:Cytochrome c oxidase subunit 7A2, mitochondrial n=1 Tax=Aotus nancymaae TaxID=37293 RepID=A0A2K5EM12_AOTNA